MFVRIIISVQIYLCSKCLTTNNQKRKHDSIHLSQLKTITPII